MSKKRMKKNRPTPPPFIKECKLSCQPRHDRFCNSTRQVGDIIPKSLQEIVPCNITLRCCAILTFTCDSVCQFNTTHQSIRLVLDMLVDIIGRRFL